MKNIFYIFLFIPLVFAGCKPVPTPPGSDKPVYNSSWPVFRGNPELTGTLAHDLPDELDLLWTFKTGRAVKSSPVIADNTVYIGSNDGYVYALALDTGSNFWRFNTGDNVEAPPLLHDIMIYAGSENGTVYAIDASSGTQVWTYSTDDKIIGSANWAVDPLTGNGRVLVGSYDAVMHCVDADAGTAVWTFATESFINGAPAADETYAVFGGCDMHVYVISLADGRLAAAIPLDSYIAGSVALAGTRAFLGHYGDALVCVDIETTNIVWQYSDPDDSAPFFSSPAVADDIVVAGARDYRVHCVERKTGKKKWTVQTKGDVDSSPVICGNSVFAASLDGRIYRINRDSGTVTWSYEIGSPVSGSPGIADGMLVIGAEDGRVYAFGRKKKVP